MKERPILLNTDMVQAVIDGRKTQTRRLVKKEHIPLIEYAAGSNDDDTEFEFLGLTYGPWKDDNNKEHEAEWLAYCSEYPEDGVLPIGQGLGAVGDRLWVRETWFQKGCYCMPMFDGADHEDAFWSGTKDAKYFASEDVSSEGHAFGEQFWRKFPSIHMPRWACRLVLEITHVRIEQVQSITEEDAIKEGLLKEARQEESDLMGWNLAKTTFKELWDKLYPNSWKNNDWVWVIDFKIVELNGKKMEQAA